MLIQITNFAEYGWAPKKLHCDVQLGNLDDIAFEGLKPPALPSDAVYFTYLR